MKMPKGWCVPVQLPRLEARVQKGKEQTQKSRTENKAFGAESLDPFFCFFFFLSHTLKCALHDLRGSPPGHDRQLPMDSTLTTTGGKKWQNPARSFLLSFSTLHLPYCCIKTVNKRHMSNIWNWTVFPLLDNLSSCPSHPRPLSIGSAHSREQS